jgi:hypothetical protein
LLGFPEDRTIAESKVQKLDHTVFKLKVLLKLLVQVESIDTHQLLKRVEADFVRHFNNG